MSKVFSAVFFTFLAYDYGRSISIEEDSKRVLFQGFNWDLVNSTYSNALIYKNIAKIANEAEGLIQGIWFPPPSQSADNPGYMPGQWYKLKDKELLLSTIALLKSKGIIAIADVVLNHRTGGKIDPCTKRWTQFQNPDWGNWAIVKNDYMCPDEGSEPVCPIGCNCSTLSDTGDNFCSAPDIDHANMLIQKDVISWLKWLRRVVGFEGYRLDLVKGFLPEYTKLYMKETKPLISFGEYWDGNTENVARWIQQSETGAFDFPLRYILDAAIKNEEYYRLQVGIHPAGILGFSKKHAVTFLDNHDTGRHGGEFGWQNSDLILQGYAYILTHPGVPCLYYDHWKRKDINSKLVEILKVRKDMGISSQSSIYIDKKQHHLYAAYIGLSNTKATQCGGVVAVKLGSDLSWSPCGEGWKIVTFGNKWAIWIKS